MSIQDIIQEFEAMEQKNLTKHWTSKRVLNRLGVGLVDRVSLVSTKKHIPVVKRII